MKRYLAEHNIDFYIIDATKIANDIGLGGRTNMIMQSAFFKLAEVLPIDEAIKHLKDSIEKTYGRKGEKVVKMNFDAVDRGIDALVKVNIPASWKDAVDEPQEDVKEVPEFIEDVVIPMNRQEGDKLPVSTFVGREDGAFPHGNSCLRKTWYCCKSAGMDNG